MPLLIQQQLHNQNVQCGFKLNHHMHKMFCFDLPGSELKSFPGLLLECSDLKASSPFCLL